MGNGQRPPCRPIWVVSMDDLCAIDGCSASTILEGFNTGLHFCFVVAGGPSIDESQREWSIDMSLCANSLVVLKSDSTMAQPKTHYVYQSVWWHQYFRCRAASVSANCTCGSWWTFNISPLSIHLTGYHYLGRDLMVDYMFPSADYI